MRTVDLIRRKRDGEELSSQEITWLVESYTRGEIPDYQMSAFLMATYFRSVPREVFGLADTLEVLNLTGNRLSALPDDLAYAIGRAHPVGFYTECFGTEKVPLNQINDAVLSVFDLRPAAIIRDLDLLRPIYSQITNYGHFGRELPVMTWERTDRADALAAAVRG